MNLTNLLIIILLFIAVLVSFFVGGYHTLLPIIFLIGLVAGVVVSGWRATQMSTRDLIILIVVTLVLALIDEYAHTITGTHTYFDQRTPSPLTVFAWGIFIIFILTAAEFIHNIPSFNIPDITSLRPIPVVLSIILIIILVVIRGYLPVFSALLVSIYVILAAFSLYYTNKHSLQWNIAVMISSLVISAGMEFLGAWEGLWSYYILEPLALFLPFTWTLRMWTILAVCFLLNVDFAP